MAAFNWLKARRLDETEIDFILTLVPALSILIRGDEFRKEIVDLLKIQFPAVQINETMDFGDYQQFKDFLENNFQDRLQIDEFIVFVEKRGCSMDWCERILTKSK